MLGLAKSSDLRRLTDEVADLRRQLWEVRAACFAELPTAVWVWDHLSPPRQYTAIEAVRLLLEHLELTVTETSARPAVRSLKPNPPQHIFAAEPVRVPPKKSGKAK